MTNSISPPRQTFLIIALALLNVLLAWLIASVWFSGLPLRPRFDTQGLGVTPRPAARPVLPPPSPFSLYPTYSPDGREIAFVSDRATTPLVCPFVCSNIWIVGVDGRNLRPLTLGMTAPAGRSRQSDPAWSPDNARIAFTSNASGNLDVWVVHIDGSSLTQLTADPADDMLPAWSPDGSQLAFVSDRTGSKQIWLADGTSPRQVTSIVGWQPGTEPDFSPDGGRLFKALSPIVQGVSRPNLMTINVDGTGMRTLTEGDFHDFNPRWSVRGIVFNSGRAGGEQAGLWLIQPDGSGLQFLFNATLGRVAVSPDGARIAFHSYDEGIYEFNFLDGKAGR